MGSPRAPTNQGAIHIVWRAYVSLERASSFIAIAILRESVNSVSRSLKITLTITAVAALALSGCSSNSTSSSSTTNNSINVFASTNVWGSIAKAVGGSLVSVTSVIARPEQDPHDYEATAQDKLAAKKAKLTITNGGGYDDWADKVIKSSGTTATAINAVDVSGLKTTTVKDFNEHVFFSIKAVKKVTEKVAGDLGKLDSKNKQKYLDNAAVFETKLDNAATAAAKIGMTHPGLTAVATEPVVGYLMADIGIKNVTPENFVAQSESDAGPSAATLDDTTKVVSDGQAKLLVLNGQTEDSVSSKLTDAANAASVPIVKVYETFPDGVTDYLTFLNQTIDAFASATANLK